MSKPLNIRFEIDPACDEPEVIIRSSQRTKLVERILSAVEGCTRDANPPIAAYRGETLVMLNQEEILRVYTESRRLMVRVESGEYVVRQPLRDLESALNGENFVRISRFEIINLQKVSGFDFSTAGTIRVIFSDGNVTWVARRYVQSIQQTLKRRSAGGEPHA